MKKDTWVVITTKSEHAINLDRSTGHMESLDGQILQLPFNTPGHGVMGDNPTDYFWSEDQSHFREAFPHEIPNNNNNNTTPTYEIY